MSTSYANDFGLLCENASQRTTLLRSRAEDLLTFDLNKLSGNTLLSSMRATFCSALLSEFFLMDLYTTTLDGENQLFSTALCLCFHISVCRFNFKEVKTDYP